MKKRMALTLPPTSDEPLFLRADFQLQWINNNVQEGTVACNKSPKNEESSYKIKEKSSEKMDSPLKVRKVDFNDNADKSPAQDGQADASPDGTSAKKKKAKKTLLPSAMLRKS